jgi:hypothetical protein
MQVMQVCRWGTGYAPDYGIGLLTCAPVALGGQIDLLNLNRSLAVVVHFFGCAVCRVFARVDSQAALQQRNLVKVLDRSCRLQFHSHPAPAYRSLPIPQIVRLG